MSLLLLARRTFPAWFLGIVGGAGALTAMVPAAIIILTASTLFAKNVYRPLLAPQMTEQGVGGLAKVMVFILALVSFFLALHSSTTLVALPLVGYAGVSNFSGGRLRAFLAACYDRRCDHRVSDRHCFGGSTVLSHRDPFHGDAGFSPSY